jgi:hypothetical protein
MSPPTEKGGREFVDELVRGGYVLYNLIADLLEVLPEDAFAGEDQLEVLIGMIAGSLSPVTEAAGPDALASATSLISAAIDRVLADMRVAAELAGATPECLN